MRSEISPAGELAWQPGQRIDECESSRQQFQRTREIIHACTRRQSRIHIIVDDRRAEHGHVHAQLVLATGDRLQPVMPGTRAALDDVDRSEAPRGGTGCVRSVWRRWAPCPSNKKKKKKQ